MDDHRGANLEVMITQIFNAYDPRMCFDGGHVVSNFVAQALRKEPLTISGDGKQTRSFQYVSDLELGYACKEMRQMMKLLVSLVGKEYSEDTLGVNWISAMV